MSQPLNPNQSVENLNPTTEGRPEQSNVTAIASAAGLNSHYFTLSTHTTDYYVWFNRGSGGSDPAPGGTGIEVDIGNSDTAAQVAAAIAAALLAVGFTTSVEGAVVQIANAVLGTATDIAAGNSGLTVSTLHQGLPERYDPKLSPASISNNPSTF